MTDHANPNFYQMAADPRFAWVDRDVLADVTPETDLAQYFGGPQYYMAFFVKHSPMFDQITRRANRVHALLSPFRAFRSTGKHAKGD